MSETPLVSFIIPALNEEEYIGVCLASIKDLDANKGSFEIIVVDNGSIDRTVEIAKDFGANVYSILGTTISKLRNYGASKAKGEILAFMDADCVITKNWLKNAIKELSDETVGVTGSNYKTYKQTSWVSKVWEFNMKEKNDRCEVGWIQSGNLIIKRKVFETIGGFDETLSVCEDSDICYRIKEIGYKIISNDRIRSYHYGFCKNLRQFFKKELWYGKGAIKLFFKHKNKTRYLNVIGFALLYAICLLTLAIGIFYIRMQLVLSSIILMLLSAFFLSLKTNLEKNEIKYLLSLTTLYFIFGIARALCLLDVRNWKIK